MKYRKIMILNGDIPILYYKNYPRLRYSVKNGLTLCVLCHRRIHSKGGGSG